VYTNFLKRRTAHKFPHFQKGLSRRRGSIGKATRGLGFAYGTREREKLEIFCNRATVIIARINQVIGVMGCEAEVDVKVGRMIEWMGQGGDGWGVLSSI
jgi:hypothetical protein